MSMSKRDFIALADVIRSENRTQDGFPVFNSTAVHTLAVFCASQNPRFNRSRWLAYIAGEVGPNGGAVKGGEK